MPKREDIHKILIIGSGPILIVQAAARGIKAARENRIEVKSLQEYHDGVK